MKSLAQIWGSAQVYLEQPADLDTTKYAPQPDVGVHMDRNGRRKKKKAEQKMQRSQCKRQIELAHDMS